MIWLERLLSLFLVFLAIIAIWFSKWIIAIFLVVIAILNLFHWVLPFLALIARFFVLLLIMGGLIYVVASFLDNNREQYLADDKSKTKIYIDTLNHGEDSIIISHYRYWEDYEGKPHQAHFDVEQNYYYSSQHFRNLLKIPYRQNEFTQYWHKVYFQLSYEDAPKLRRLYDFFDSVKVVKDLSSLDFAEYIVTSVQDIPYTYIIDLDCDSALQQDYITDVNACMPYMKFGLQSPVEFIYNLKGDCDTRALLLYNLLSYFGYDVAILVSYKYGHAMLGLNLPGTIGEFVKYQGKRYYVWETTSTGYQLGIFPTRYNDANNWSIALTST